MPPTNIPPASANSTSDTPDILPNWAYANGMPSSTGRIKLSEDDFKVFEQMPIELSGQGEHIWLKVRKRKQSTEQVAKALARYANIAYRDVGYAGMKDVFAVTEQWFSIYRPGATNLEFHDFEFPGVELLEVGVHSRKLKRGTHKSNYFEICVRELDGGLDELEQRLTAIRDSGVPNYYGPQRFGRGAANLLRAEQLFSGEKKIKDRALRSIVISSARSFLFNQLLSKRIEDDTWSQLHDSEPANLDGSNSFFLADREANQISRLSSLDIHPSCALWGDGDREAKDNYTVLHSAELDLVNEYPILKGGLERAGLKLERRATRMAVKKLTWRFDDSNLHLNFELSKGQFATSVLRELVVIKP